MSSLGRLKQIGLKLRTLGIVPEEEQNDASVIAEAALIDCKILLSSDWHLLEAQEHSDFRQTLKDFDVTDVLIARLVTKFFSSK